MTKTTKQYRTAAAVIEGIQARFDEESSILLDAEAEVSTHRTRLKVIMQILADAVKPGSTNE